MFKTIFLTLILAAFSFANPIHANEIPLDKQRDIRTLIGLAVINNLAKFQIPVELRRFEMPMQKADAGVVKVSPASIHEAMKASSARIESEAEKIMAEIMQEPGELVDLLIPIYDKYYEHREIQELIDFLQSQSNSPSERRAIEFIQTPLARKLIMADPSLTQESEKVSNEWRRSHTFELRRRISLGLIGIGARPVLARFAQCPIGERDPNYYPSHQLDVPPKISGRVQPEYPKQADENHISGSVQLRMKIDEYGLVQEIAISNSTPPGVFDQSAIDAFSKAAVLPACKNGVTVRSVTHIQVQYDPTPVSSSH